MALQAWLALRKRCPSVTASTRPVLRATEQRRNIDRSSREADQGFPGGEELHRKSRGLTQVEVAGNDGLHADLGGECDEVVVIGVPQNLRH